MIFLGLFQPSLLCDSMWKPCFYLLVCPTFVAFIKLHLSEPIKFPHFHSSDSLPHPARGWEWAAVRGFVTSWGKTTTTFYKKREIIEKYLQCIRKLYIKDLCFPLTLHIVATHKTTFSRTTFHRWTPFLAQVLTWSCFERSGRRSRSQLLHH